MSLDEKSLQLDVSNKSLESLTESATQIKKLVQDALPTYDICNYSEDNLDLAKTDKAALNKASKALNSKRLEIEREYMQPFNQFKDIINDTCKLITECSTKIDVVVKEAEQQAKDKRRAEVETIWDATGFKLVPFTKVFDNRWLNKGSKDKDVKAEMLEVVAKIQSDIATINAIGEDVELLTSMYLDNLDLNSTIQHARRLKDNRERMAEEAKIPTVESAPEIQHIPAPKHEPAPAPTVHAACIVRAFKVTATKEQIIAVAAFMDSQRIQYEKIDLGEAENTTNKEAN